MREAVKALALSTGIASLSASTREFVRSRYAMQT
jgi:hypothetical protein